MTPDRRPKRCILLATTFAALGCGAGGDPAPGASGPDEARNAPPQQRVDTAAISFSAGGAAPMPAAVREFCQPMEGGPGSARRSFDSAGWDSLAVVPVHDEVESTFEEPYRCVIRTEDEWSAFRVAARLSPPAEAVPVDFSRQMLVAAGMGVRPTWGFSVVTGPAFTRGDTAAIFAHHRRPTTDIVSDAPTSPLHVVRVDRKSVIWFVQM